MSFGLSQSSSTMCMLPVISTLLYPLLSAAAGLASASTIELTMARQATSAAVVFVVRYSRSFLPVVGATVSYRQTLDDSVHFYSCRVVLALCERSFGLVVELL